MQVSVPGMKKKPAPYSEQILTYSTALALTGRSAACAPLMAIKPAAEPRMSVRAVIMLPSSPVLRSPQLHEELVMQNSSWSMTRMQSRRTWIAAVMFSQRDQGQPMQNVLLLPPPSRVAARIFFDRNCTGWAICTPKCISALPRPRAARALPHGESLLQLSQIGRLEPALPIREVRS